MAAVDVHRRIQTLAEEHAEARARRDGGHCAHVPPASCEIVQQRDGRVWFVFHFMVLFSAQSGSDWYHHLVFAGTATDTGDVLADVALECLRDANLDEHTVEWAKPPYDAASVARADRDAWLARVRPE